MFKPPHSYDDESRDRRWVIAGTIAAAVLVLGAILLTTTWWSSGPVEEPPQADAAPATPADAAESADVREAPAEAKPPAPPRRRPRPEPTEAPPEPEPEAAPAFTLRIDSDIEGASVFVDRQYLGTAPVETTAITPGTHQLNASAEGYDGIVRTIEVADSGPTTITLRFREVTLDLTIAVVHKHAMGSCEGQLQATTSGFRYASSNKNDAFALPFSAVEQFEIDYLKNNLRIKQKGGRTWNFTEPSGDADKLFVFHRDVSKARDRLAGLGREP